MATLRQPTIFRAVMEQQWCELIGDLLNEIDAHLTYIEKVRVRATCVSWNSLLSKMPNHKLPQLPWLLQTSVNNEGSRSHGLFNLCDKKFYQLDLPELQGKLLKGSSHGWLVVISVDQEGNTPSSPDMCLINPLTGLQIQLPPRSTFPDVENYYPDRDEEYFLFTGPPVNDLDSNHVHLHLTHKVVTSSSCSEKCVVVAIYGERFQLAWCALSHKKWTPLDIYLDTGISHLPIEDVIFSNNKLYAVNCNGGLFEVENIGGLNQKAIVIAQEIPQGRTGDYIFLVECSDRRLIMVVARFYDFMKSFEAYELDSHDSCWRLVNNIGNEMIFLGYNLSFSVPACEFPGYRGNCIYFTDNPNLFSYKDGKEGDAEIGIFNLDEGNFEPLPGFPTVSRSLWPPPIWVTPPNYRYL